MMQIKSDKAVLGEILTIRDQQIVDIGSGDGNLVRFLTRQGAKVTGLECGAAQLKKARACPAENDEIYVEGFAQLLPFADAGFDVAIFFNSLHHVPVDRMDAALKEAGRVTKPDGVIYVAEPLAKGSGYTFSAPLDDEAEIRAAAYQAIKRAAGHGLKMVREVIYDTVYHYENFEAFKEEAIRIGPERSSRFGNLEASLRKAFDRYGVPDEIGVRFEQPIRVNVLEKIA